MGDLASNPGLRFNICDLNSYHLCNADVPDLEERVGKHIPLYVSY
jgi:hypothetical protein